MLKMCLFVNYYTKAIAWDIPPQIGCDILTDIYPVDPSILIKWTTPFPVLGVSGVGDSGASSNGGKF